jgi:O-methyltransferase
MVDSRGERLFEMAPAPVKLVAQRGLAQLPIARWPGWLGTLNGIKVPRNVARRATPEPTGSANINILLDLLERSLPVDGDVAECGVFRGATLVTLGLYLRERYSSKRLYGFDSFEGFDDSVATDVELGGADDPHKTVGGFGTTSAEHLAEKLRRFDLDARVSLIKGFFKDTLPQVSARTFAFVHLDCDIYQSYKDCLEFFWPRMSSGAIVLFDEYNDPPWPGCNKAIDEFFAERVEKPTRIERDGYEKWYVVKA